MPKVKLSDGEHDLTLKQIRERAGEVNERMKAAAKDFNTRKKQHDDGKDVELWPDDTRAQWEAINADLDALRTAHDEEQRAADVAARLSDAQQWLDRSERDHIRGRPGLDDQGDEHGRSYGDLGFEDRDLAREYAQRRRDANLSFRAWASYGVHGVELGDDHREACERIGFNPAQSMLSLRLLDTYTYGVLQRSIRDSRPEAREGIRQRFLEHRTLSGTVGASGGYITGPGMLVPSLELAAVEYGAMLQVAETITTETGEEMAWPVGDDTSNTGKYTDENTDESSSTADPSFEQVRWRSYDMFSKFIKVPFQLIRDSIFNLDAVLGQMLGERLGRFTSAECTTGAAKIRGIITRAPVGQTSAAAGAIARADLVGLQHSVDPARRAGSRFMFHDAILEAIRLLVDLNGLPIYQNNTRTGGVDTIEGWPFVINQQMASTIATTNKCVVGGRLEQYKLRRVGPSLRLKRLVERFAESDQTAFAAYWAVDGNLLRPSSTAATDVQVLQQA